MSRIEAIGALERVEGRAPSVSPPDGLKRCSSCSDKKHLSQFNKCASGTYGLHNHCRECQRVCKRRYYVKNRDREIERSRIRGKSPEAKAAARLRYLRERERITEYNRARRRTADARVKANAAKRRLEARDPSQKAARNLRSRIRLVLRGKNKSASMLDLAGCDLRSLRNHLERQFGAGMSWENYGYRGWHIDHIRPCAAFDLTNAEEQRRCFHFLNLRPMWRVENQSKGGKCLTII